jgi:hypothetical protein
MGSRHRELSAEIFHHRDRSDYEGKTNNVETRSAASSLAASLAALRSMSLDRVRSVLCALRVVRG